jgi:transposase InsO family protein
MVPQTRRGASSNTSAIPRLRQSTPAHRIASDVDDQPTGRVSDSPFDGRAIPRTPPPESVLSPLSSPRASSPSSADPASASSIRVSASADIPSSSVGAEGVRSLLQTSPPPEGLATVHLARGHAHPHPSRGDPPVAPEATAPPEPANRSASERVPYPYGSTREPLQVLRPGQQERLSDPLRTPRSYGEETASDQASFRHQQEESRSPPRGPTEGTYQAPFPATSQSPYSRPTEPPPGRAFDPAPRSQQPGIFEGPRYPPSTGVEGIASFEGSARDASRRPPGLRGGRLSDGGNPLAMPPPARNWNNQRTSGNQFASVSDLDSVVTMINSLRNDIMFRFDQGAAERHGIHDRLAHLERLRSNATGSLPPNVPVMANPATNQTPIHFKPSVSPSLRVQSEAPLPPVRTPAIFASLPRTVRENLSPTPEYNSSGQPTSRNPPSRSLSREDYPSYDGHLQSNHVQFVKHITQLRDLRNIPDSEILSMLPLILTDNAKRWWEYELVRGYTTWNQWATALIERFSKDSWMRHISDKIQESRFTDAHLSNPTGWATSYIQLLESFHVNLSVAEIRHLFARAIPPDLAQALEQAVQFSMFTGREMSVAEYISLFEDQAEHYKRRVHALRPPANRPNQQRFNNNYNTNRGPVRSNFTRSPHQPINQQRTYNRPPTSNDPSSTRAQPARTSENRGASLRPGDMNPVKCYNCQRTGHIAKDCPNAPVHAIAVDEQADEAGYDAAQENLSPAEEDDQYECNNWEDYGVLANDDQDDVPLQSLAVDMDALANDWGQARPWFDWSDEPLEIEIERETMSPDLARAIQLQSIEAEPTSTSPDLNDFFSQSDISLSAFRVYLAQYGLAPEDTGPTIVRLPNAFHLPTPASRAVLQDFLRVAEEHVTLNDYPALSALKNRRNNYRWLWLHTREFVLLNIALSHDTAVLSRADHPPLSSVAPVRVVSPPTLLEASLVRKGHEVPSLAAPPVIRVLINGTPEYVTLDTGAAISVINEVTFRRHFPDALLAPSPIPTLKAFGHRIDPAGTFTVSLTLDHPTSPVSMQVPFLVLRTNTCPTPVLLGMNVIRAYGIDILYSSRIPSMRIGSIPHSISLVKRPDLLPRLQAVVSSEPLLDRGQATPDLLEFQVALDKAIINPDLTADQDVQLRATLSTFPLAFAHGSNQLGKCFENEMVIDVDIPSPTPSSLRKAAYPISPKSRVDMDAAIDDLISWDIIQPSRSQYASPAIMTYLKGKPRMCVDYRALNTYIIPITYPMPRISESLSLLHGAQYISCLDANKGFHQIRINEKSQHLTAFSTHRGLFQYRRMPFGLKTAPAIFQGIMDRVLHSELRQGWARVYIDDILVFSPSFDEHLKHLKIIFSRLETAGFTLSLAKCQFAFKELHALGHKVSGLQITIADNHLAAVKNIATPHDIPSLRSALGFAGWQANKIPNFHIIAKDLYKLLRKDVPWQWMDSCHKAWNAIKDIMTSAPVVSVPRDDLPFRLYLDASYDGLGASLCQTHDGREVALCYISRQLRSSEQKYGATQLECLALVWALQKLHYYLDGAQFEVVTDCTAVKSLINMKTPNRHMLRWQLAIQEFRGQMTIIHRAGKANVIADALSRAPLPNDVSNPAADLDDALPPQVLALDIHDFTSALSYAPLYLPTIHALSIASLNNELISVIQQGYEDDPDFFRVVEALRAPSFSLSEVAGGLPKPLARDFTNGRFFIMDLLLYRRKGISSTLVIADKPTRTMILSSCHDDLVSGHLTPEKTIEFVRQVAWWPGLHKDVEDYVKSCPTCQRAKRATGKRYGLMIKIETPSRPWEIINMDFVTGLPPAGSANYNAVLVVVDRFSRMAFFIPTHDTADAKDTAELFWHRCWSRTGLPRVIISDRDPKFTSAFWQSLHSMLGTRLALSTAHHPQTDGLAERTIQTLEDMLRRFVAFGISYEDPDGQHRDWISILPALEMAYNSSKHSTTQEAPFVLERGYLPYTSRSLLTDRSQTLHVNPASESYGRLLRSARDRAQQCIDESIAYAKQRWDASHTPPKFKVGDRVMISTLHFGFSGPAKLREHFAGPFAVLRLIGDNAIEVALTGEFARKHPVFPVSLCKPYRDGNPERFPGRREQPPPEPEFVDEEPEWVIDKIIDERSVKAGRNRLEREYHVRWKGYDSSHDLWLPESEMKHAKDALRVFRLARRNEVRRDDSSPLDE